MPMIEPMPVHIETGYLKVNFLVFRDAYAEDFQSVCFPHNHINYELHYIASGACSFTINDQLYPAKKGDVLIIPPQKYHGLLKEHIQPGFSQYTFYFFLDAPDNAVEEAAHKTFSDFVSKNHLIPTASSKIDAYCLQLNEEAKHNTIGSFNVFQAFCSLILTEALRSSQINLQKIYQDPRAHHDNYNQNNIDEFFNKNYYSNLKIQDLANYLNFSIRHTNTILNKLYGMSFTQKLIQTRLSVAKNQLIYTDHSIAQICYDCGFQSHSFFNTCFRKHFGINPSEFRKIKRQK